MKSRIAVLALIALSLVGCGQIDRAAAAWTGYSVVCVKETGVKYVQFTSGAAVLVDQNGNPVKCN